MVRKVLLILFILGPGSLAYTRKGTMIALLTLLSIITAEAQSRSPTKPTGPHCIGKTSFVIADSSQMEYHTADSSDIRMLMVDAWYPGKCKSTAPVPYIDAEVMEHYMLEELPDSLNPDFIKNHIGYAAFNDPPANFSPLPVIIFSPGSSTPVALYTYMLEEMASHGYFVFGMSHTFDVPAKFPDGTFYPRYTQYIDRQFTKEVLDSWSDLLESLSGPGEVAAKIKLIQDHFLNFPGTENTRKRAKDMHALLSALDLYNRDKNHLLYQKLDLNKIGGLGHSFGGACIGQCSLNNTRLKAGINMDGWQFGDMVFDSVSIPFMLMRTGTPRAENEFNDLVFNMAKSAVTMVWIKDTGHSNFSDLPLLLGAGGLKSIGGIDPEQGSQIINRLIVGFFDRILKNDGTLFNQALHSPLVHVERR